MFSNFFEDKQKLYSWNEHQMNKKKLKLTDGTDLLPLIVFVTFSLKTGQANLLQYKKK